MRISTFLRAARNALFAASLAAPALSHDVFPMTLELRPGGEDYFFVVDQFICPATITVTSVDPNLVQVFAVNMTTGAVLSGGGSTASAVNRIDQVFLVRAASNITVEQMTMLQVCWIGSNYPLPPCNENNCNPFAPHMVHVTIRPPADTAGAALTSSIFGDPVAMATGELLFVEPPDLELGGPMPLEFARYYGSRVQLQGGPATTLGPNWLHNFAWRLVRTGNNVEIHTNTGRVVRFEKRHLATTWSLEVAEDVPYTLVEAGAGFVLGDTLAGRVLTFDSQGRLTKIQNGRGAEHTLTYAGSNLASVSDGLGRALSFTHNGANRMTAVSDGTRTVALAYDGHGRLASATDAATHATTYAYDATAPSAALLTGRTLPRGNTPVTMTYDADRRVATQTDATGATYSFSYNTVTHATTATDPAGETQVHDHDAQRRLTVLADEGGATITTSNDALGRRTSVRDRLGRTTSWSYNSASGGPAAVTESSGAQTSFTYATQSVSGVALHDVAQVTRADGGREMRTYSGGNVASYTDAANRQWTYTHNAHGQVLTKTSPAGGVTSYVYNPDGTLASIETPDGETTSFSYDALRRVASVTRPGGASASFTHDARDRVLTITDELGDVTTNVYDDNGNLVEQIDAAGGSWTFAYDAMDRMTSAQDPLGDVSSANYDDRGRLASVTNALGDAIDLAYDAQGRVVGASDELGRSASIAYDAEGFVTARTDPNGKTAAFQNNPAGLPTRFTTPLGHATNFAYDSMGRRRSMTLPGGSASSLTFDKRGLPASASLPLAGATSSFARDEFGNVTMATLPGGRMVHREYDVQGRLVMSSDPAQQETEFSYDARGRLDVVTLPGALGEIDYDYDEAGRLTRREASDGTVESYSYDTAGRVTQAGSSVLGWDAAGRLIHSEGLDIEYDAAGRLAKLVYGPGLEVDYVYDAAGRVTSISDWVGGATTFEYDPAGHCTRIARPNGVETVMAYDDDGELISSIDRKPSPLPALAGFFDLGGHYLQRDSRGRVASANRLLPFYAKPSLLDEFFSYNAAWQPQSSLYDTVGRRLSFGGLSYQWDLLGRLKEQGLDGGPVETSYEWNGLDLPVALSRSGVVQQFDWNHALTANRPWRRTVDVADAFYYIHTPMGELLHRIRGGANERSFYHYDEMGSVMFRTDEQGEIGARYSYTPWGHATGAKGEDDDPFTYRGRDGFISGPLSQLYFDPNYGKRFYDADTISYLSRDPRVRFDPLGANPYRFADLDPLNNRSSSLREGFASFTYSAEGQAPDIGAVRHRSGLVSAGLKLEYSRNAEEQPSSNGESWTISKGSKFEISAGYSWRWNDALSGDFNDVRYGASEQDGEFSAIVAVASQLPEPAAPTAVDAATFDPLPRNHAAAVFKFRTLWIHALRSRRDRVRPALFTSAFAMSQMLLPGLLSHSSLREFTSAYKTVEVWHFYAQLRELAAFAESHEIAMGLVGSLLAGVQSPALPFLMQQQLRRTMERAAAARYGAISSY